MYSNLSRDMLNHDLRSLSPVSIVSRSKTKWYKHQKNKKLTLNPQLQTYQILTNDDQMFILCLSYFITTVHAKLEQKEHA